jgi:hypothetical protein
VLLRLLLLPRRGTGARTGIRRAARCRAKAVASAASAAAAARVSSAWLGCAASSERAIGDDCLKDPGSRPFRSKERQKCTIPASARHTVSTLIALCHTAQTASTPRGRQKARFLQSQFGKIGVTEALSFFVDSKFGTQPLSSCTVCH